MQQDRQTLRLERKWVLTSQTSCRNQGRADADPNGRNEEVARETPTPGERGGGTCRRRMTGRTNKEGQLRDQRPPANQRCIWCDATGHARRDCTHLGEALRSNVVYLSNGRVDASDTRKLLDKNFGRGGMKRLMEETATRHVEAVHYSAAVGIRIGEKAAKPD